jgi:hypothetical protein
MSKVNEALRDFGIAESSLPSGLAAQKRKYDKMLAQLEVAKQEVGWEEEGKLEELESEIFEYGEEIIGNLDLLATKRAEKEEAAKARAERKKAREAKKRAAAAAKAPEPTPAPEPVSQETPEPEVEEDAKDTIAEMVNAAGEVAEQQAQEAEVMEEKEESSGLSLSSILIGGLVLLTTYGAYNYFKRK